MQKNVFHLAEGTCLQVSGHSSLPCDTLSGNLYTAGDPGSLQIFGFILVSNVNVAGHLGHQQYQL